MKIIFKYQLAPARHPVEMPKGGKILHVAEQNGEPFIWALVDPDAPKVERVFRTYGTGWEIPELSLDLGTLTYIDTFMLEGGALVFHVFEETP